MLTESARSRVSALAEGAVAAAAVKGDEDARMHLVNWLAVQISREIVEAWDEGWEEGRAEGRYEGASAANAGMSIDDWLARAKPWEG